MKIIEYICVRTYGFIEAYEIRARFPEAYAVEKGTIDSRFVEFLLPIEMKEEVSEFVNQFERGY